MILEVNAWEDNEAAAQALLGKPHPFYTGLVCTKVAKEQDQPAALERPAPIPDQRKPGRMVQPASAGAKDGAIRWLIVYERVPAKPVAPAPAPAAPSATP
jgi:hypothetical protein